MNYKVLALILSAVLVLVFGTDILSVNRHTLNSAKPVSAHEIYPLFICPCCGQPIDTDCCDMARERKTFVDGLTKGRLSKDEIILTYVKKYGLDSFKDADKKEEFRQKLVAEAPLERPIISLNPDTYDFGDVSQKAGIVTTSFELENKGQNDLVIKNLETSCGCTSVAIVYQGVEGPKFGMPGHGVNEAIQDWRVTIPAGGKAELKVYYDPNVHPDFRGAAIRTISVFSNDPIDFEKSVQIELNQVD